MKATYNITNDKLKFWPEERLPKETYDRARHAGFTFWHGSKCFAAKWSTQAEDLVLELGGVIEQDDSPDDVEARVERFSKYADGAQQQAESSEEYLNTKANTERRRKNAINSMEKGISQAEHWKQRIEGAIRNATYKERPDVIARRIEGLEKDLRKMLRNQDRKNFNVPEDCYDREAYAAYNRRKLVLNGQLNEDKKNDKPWTQAQKDVAIAELRELRSKVFFEDKIAAAFKPTFDWAQRWIDHINQRLQYERASLEAAGGVVGGVGAAPIDKEKFQVGGAVKGGVSGHNFRIITKVNKRTVEVYDTGCNWKHYWKVDRTEIFAVATKAEVDNAAPATELFYAKSNYNGYLEGLAKRAKAEKKHFKELDALCRQKHGTGYNLAGGYDADDTYAAYLAGDLAKIEVAA